MGVLGKLGPVGLAITAGQAALAAREHWGLLEPRDRDRLRELVGSSRGVPGNLTPAEREELKQLARKLELGRLGRRVVAGALPLGRRFAGRR